MSWTREQAKALADRILSFSKAPECEVSSRLSQNGHTRFAANDITTAGMVRDSLRSRSPAATAGERGSTTTDELDDPSLLREAVARSEALMAAAQPDPEHVEGLAPQKYPRSLPSTTPPPPPGPSARRDGVKAALDAGPREGPRTPPAFRDRRDLAGDRQQEGQFRLPPRTSAEISTTMRTARRHRLRLRRAQRGADRRCACPASCRRSPPARPRPRPIPASCPRAATR